MESAWRWLVFPSVHIPFTIPSNWFSNHIESPYMPLLTNDPFDSIESAHSFLTLLRETVSEAKREVDNDVQRTSDSSVSRRLDALRIAAYKMEKLEFHLNRSSRILDDLRSLRRLLFEERMNRTGDTRAGRRELVALSQSRHSSR
jgi:hypothetical protein